MSESAKKKKPVRCSDRDIVYQRILVALLSRFQWGSRCTGLGGCGLIGKFSFTSDMTEEEIMKFDPNFPFTFLQSTGSGTKTDGSCSICSFSVDSSTSNEPSWSGSPIHPGKQGAGLAHKCHNAYMYMHTQLSKPSVTSCI